MKPEFDAIVVGAGPAGGACAYSLAKQGRSVLLIERGKYAGAKNVWGGALYGPTLGQLIPEFHKEAPIERYVSRHVFSVLCEGSLASFEYRPAASAESSDRGIIVIRAKFDRWLAQKAEQAGVVLAAGLEVEDLLQEDGRVVGVKAGGDNIPANVVIACDGANSILAQQAGLRGEFKPHDVKQGVKEVISLPQSVIEQRFNVKDGEGVAWQFLGCTRGMPGGGFIYTNKESVAIGVVVNLGALMDSGATANDLLEDFKKHPVVSDLIAEGELVEYSAHLIPDLKGKLPRLYADGILVAGDAAGFVLGTGLILEGANFALASSLAAADTVVSAVEKDDFSAKSLSRYQTLLAESFVLKDLRTFRKAGHFLENPRIYSVYPQLACALAGRVFTNDGQPRKRLWQMFLEEKKGKVSWRQMIGDFIRARGAL